MSKADFRVEEFKNHIGQTLKPGDPIIFAGSCWGSTTIRRGTFEGVYYGREYWDKSKGLKVVAIRVTYPTTKSVWNDGAGYKFSLGHDNKLSDVPCIRTSRLPLKRAYRIDTTLAEAHSA